MSQKFKENSQKCCMLLENLRKLFQLLHSKNNQRFFLPFYELRQIFKSFFDVFKLDKVSKNYLY